MGACPTDYGPQQPGGNLSTTNLDTNPRHLPLVTGNEDVMQGVKEYDHKSCAIMGQVWLGGEDTSLANCCTHCDVATTMHRNMNSGTLPYNVSSPASVLAWPHQYKHAGLL